MRQDILRMRLYLVGGQVVERLVPVTDDQNVDLESLNEFAQTLKDAGKIWLSNGRDGAFVVPNMENVALIEVEGIGDHEQI